MEEELYAYKFKINKNCCYISDKEIRDNRKIRKSKLIGNANKNTDSSNVQIIKEEYINTLIYQNSENNNYNPKYVNSLHDKSNNFPPAGQGA